MQPATAMAVNTIAARSGHPNCDSTTRSVFVRILNAFVILSCLASVACGGGPALSPQEQTAITQMERALDAARRSQEGYYARNGTYTTDPVRLDIRDVPGQTELVLEYATVNTYFVWASHPSTEWLCFVAQPADRPFYTRCVPPEEAAGFETDSARLDLVRPAG